MSDQRCLNIGMKHDPEGEVTLVLAGKCNGGSLGELRRAIDKARRAQQQIVIDLSEVTLVDRPSLQFLAEQSREDVRLVNCPEYIQPWIFREPSQ
jgi:anti-anti-sigma regulatory factor